MKRSARINWVANKRRCYRWFSQQAFVINFALLGSWQAMPADLKSAIPSNVIFGIAMVICVAGFLGRLVDQTPQEPKDHAD
jgi:hypothetical protein